MVGVLGVLKSGGAYLPLDPTVPGGAARSHDRGRAHLRARHPREASRTSSPVPTSAQTVLLDGDAERALGQEPTGDPLSEVGPSNLAYVIYTSGSTGRPKGVLVRHGGLTNYSNT